MIFPAERSESAVMLIFFQNGTVETGAKRKSSVPAASVLSVAVQRTAYSLNVPFFVSEARSLTVSFLPEAMVAAFVTVPTISSPSALPLQRKGADVTAVAFGSAASRTGVS